MSETQLMTVAEAIAVLDAAPVSTRNKRVRLEVSQGLRLAQNITSDRDYPPFDKSLMDGYAVRCEDVKTTPVELEVIGEIAAGQRASRSLERGQAMAIMTGAPIPENADGVVPVEDIVREGSRVRVLRADGPSRFITPRGADCRAGSTVLKQGTKLNAAQLAVAASVGAAEVEVFDRPRVVVLSTGDEIVPVDGLPGDAQIRNSNNIMLMALLRQMGCDVTDLGIARDDPQIIRDAIQKGLKFDALFVSGGMSMGQYDFVPKILVELGVELKITKLRIKPGKPFIFGQTPDAIVFGLPGNPVSSFVCTLRLCSRIIARMSGTATLEQWRSGSLEAPLEANGSREFYQPAILRGLSVMPLKWKGSADIYTLAHANALIVRGENARAAQEGELIDVLEIPS